MRRVVSDQITALNALAEVVKRQSGLVDMSGPGVHLAAGKKDPGPGKAEGAAVPAPQDKTAGAPREAKEQRSVKTPPEPAPVVNPQPRAATPVPAFPSLSDAPVVQPVSTIRGRPVDSLLKSAALPGSADLLPRLQGQVTTVAIDPRGRTNGGGRASVSRETEILVSKLNSVARDLIEAVDGKLADDLERRFNGGESHVYTHRLFQARGQRLFADVQQRYGRERVMRGRVDAFIRLFERLLDTVAESQKGDELVDACLNSESGKVYLMLAQATGRLNA
jgi:hypothetical protein